MKSFRTIFTIMVLVIMGMGFTCSSPANPNHYVKMQWVAGSETPYQIHRSIDGINFSVIATTSNVTFTDTNVVPNHRYWYFVSNSVGKSNTVSATIP